MCKIRRILWLSSDVGFIQLELWKIPKQDNKFPEFLDLETLLGVGRLHNGTGNNLSERAQLGQKDGFKKDHNKEEGDGESQVYNQSRHSV